MGILRNSISTSMTPIDPGLVQELVGDGIKRQLIFFKEYQDSDVVLKRQDAPVLLETRLHGLSFHSRVYRGHGTETKNKINASSESVDF